jgi:hypothetical protein
MKTTKRDAHNQWWIPVATIFAGDVLSFFFFFFFFRDPRFFSKFVFSAIPIVTGSPRHSTMFYANVFERHVRDPVYPFLVERKTKFFGSGTFFSLSFFFFFCDGKT